MYPRLEVHVVYIESCVLAVGVLVARKFEIQRVKNMYPDQLELPVFKNKIVIPKQSYNNSTASSLESFSMVYITTIANVNYNTNNSVRTTKKKRK